ncbi:MAG TPA: LLM class F420-dependent oxidoreductase [Chloroflexia bacterium]|nr:LLM class F420-dependent oxidoreductase [Chloroflexia bacterium]
MLMGMQLRPLYPGEHGNHFDTALAVVRACEEAGLDSVWMADHFMFVDEERPEKETPVMECFVTLGAFAAATSRIRIGQLVAGVPYRNPALLAKMCATLDVISHGRSIVGLGAGWHEPEFRAYGWPFPSVRERMEMLEEAVQIVDRMLTQRPASFSGKHYSVHNAYNDPMPVQKPRPPIMIGGSGEQVTLKLVARYADYCNVGGDPAKVAHRFGVLREHCNSVGRPFGEITLCNNVGIVLARNEAELAAKKEKYPGFGDIQGTPEMVVERLAEYAKVGSRYVTFHMPDADEIEPILLMGEAVLPRVAEM